MSEIDARCSTIADLATRYLEGVLPPAQETSYETHLVFCRGCVAFLSDIREIRGRLRELPADPVEGDERRRIVEAADGGR